MPFSSSNGLVVRRFENGYLEVTGRVTDVIHRGGETVSAIWSAAAVPLPDEYLGEKICAAVVFADTPISSAELNG